MEYLPVKEIESTDEEKAIREVKTIEPVGYIRYPVKRNPVMAFLAWWGEMAIKASKRVFLVVRAKVEEENKKGGGIKFKFPEP